MQWGFADEIKSKRENIIAMILSLSLYVCRPLVDGLSHLLHAVGSRYGVEVYAGNAVSNEFLALGRTPLNAYLTHLVVGLATEHLGSKSLRDIDLEGFGDDAELAGRFEGFDAGDDGNGDSFGTSALYETEILLIVIEQLGYGILGTGFYLFFKPVDIHLHVGRLIVFLGIARYTIGERQSRLLDG